jgi:choline dehydrogenase-like flavoprotein
MILSLRSLPHGTVLRGDVCIVGTGPAGITLASELLDSDLKIVVLESGDLHLDSATQDLYRGTIDGPVPTTPLHASRLRLFGGTSNVWTGSRGPLEPIDFESRSWMPLSGWPLSRAELDPYYERAHRLMEAGPFDYGVAYWRDPNHTYLDLGHGDLTHRVRCRTPTRFGPAFRARLEQARNLELLFHANVTRIVTSENGSQVTSLTARALEGEEVEVQTRATVLACGGIENPRLLLANGFGERLDYVGRCFMFHPRPQAGLLVLSRPVGTGESNPYSVWSPRHGSRVRFSLGLSEAAQRREQLPNHGVKLRATAPLPSDAWKRLLRRARGTHPLADLSEDVMAVIGDLDEIAGRARYSLFESEKAVRALEVVVYFDQVPQPSSRITLTEHVDALGTPLARLHWTHSEDERHSLQRFLEFVAKQVGAVGAGRLKIDADLTEEEVFVQRVREGGGGEHHMGTTRMSRSRSTGVVDAEGRVHGTVNLYCAGSSVFPTGGWINPTLTIAALASRLAKHLRATLS